MADKRPNILWYCTDQQRFDTIGALGNPHVRTPTLDRLVASGAAFTHAYCQSPICTPSRSSFMTGMYPGRIHNCRNGNESFANHPKLISRQLADSGYDCGMVGKFHLQSAASRTEPRLDDGYSYWRFSHAPRDDWAQGHDYADWVRHQGGDLNSLRQSDDRVPPDLHQTKWASDCALEFITQRRSQPWMLTVNVYDPHPPFIPPRSYAERFDPNSLPGPHFRETDLQQQRRLGSLDFQTQARPPSEFEGRQQQALYYAMIAQIDDQLERILTCLEETGERENTVIIFTSDHGEMLGDHGLLYKGCRFYEGLVRVPLIFSWKDQIAAGLRSDALVELIDKSATILDLAGVAAPAQLQGKSLVPILKGEKAPNHHRDFVRCEYYDAIDSAFVPGSGDGTFATMYRDRRYKLCIYHGHQLGELYDLEADPWEFNNLWHDPGHSQIKSDLVHASFDATLLASMDVGSQRIGPY